MDGTQNISCQLHQCNKSVDDGAIEFMVVNIYLAVCAYAHKVREVLPFNASIGYFLLLLMINI